MSTWFRFHTEALNDPKVQSLSPEIFKAWINILCLFAQDSNDFLPDYEQISFALRFKKAKTSRIISELIERGLLDVDDENRLSPHNWAYRQYKSDNSTERTKRFKERSRNAIGNVPGTPYRDRVQSTDTEEEILMREARAREEGYRIHHIPPSMEEVIAHGVQVGVPPDLCEEFHLHYETQGWLVGNGLPMDNWQAALRSWKVNESKKPKQGASNGQHERPRKRGIDEPRRTTAETADQYIESMAIARRSGLPDR